MLKVLVLLIICAGGYYFWSQSDSRICSKANGTMVNGLCQAPLPKEQCERSGGKLDEDAGGHCVSPMPEAGCTALGGKINSSGQCEVTK
jgi:hypothetical protein